MIRAALLFLSVSAMVPRVARADDENDGQSAYRRAVRYSILGKYEEAEKSYEAAFLATAEPRLLVDIGHSYRLQGRYSQAVRSFSSYLRLVPAAGDRDEVQRLIDDSNRDIHLARKRLASARRQRNRGTSLIITGAVFTLGAVALIGVGGGFMGCCNGQGTTLGIGLMMPGLFFFGPGGGIMFGFGSSQLHIGWKRISAAERDLDLALAR